LYDSYDIFMADLDGKIVKQLTHSKGYDAEATVNIDPRVLARAVNGLAAHTLIIEQLKRETASIDPNEPPDVYYELRIQDEDQPEFRQIVMTTLVAS
jgi:hypothetical protein